MNWDFLQKKELWITLGIVGLFGLFAIVNKFLGG